MTELERRYSCHYCGASGPAGSFLRVVPVDRLRSPFTVCRPGLSPRCVSLAGRASEFRIELLSPRDARQFDQQAAGAPQP